MMSLTSLGLPPQILGLVMDRLESRTESEIIVVMVLEIGFCVRVAPLATARTSLEVDTWTQEKSKDALDLHEVPSVVPYPDALILILGRGEPEYRVIFHTGKSALA